MHMMVISHVLLRDHTHRHNILIACHHLHPHPCPVILSHPNLWCPDRFATPRVKKLVEFSEIR
jgi:hypothetical protein